VLPEPVRRFWSAAIELSPLAERFDWGYVETDPRYPDVWDANNATILTPSPGLTLEQIRARLWPRLSTAGARREHVEFWELGVDFPALRQARAIGMTERTDLVMTVQEGSTIPRPEVEVVELADPPPDFWAWYRRGLNEFGEETILDDSVLNQLVARTREVFLPTGERFFIGTIDGVRAGYACLIRLDGVGYLDTVVTMPGYRRRGVATATVSAAVEASRSSGDGTTFLLADEGERPALLYERLGFRVASRIETLSRPLPEP
jgi:ribosomal protein S18 acetylase RimI-like enzyme